MIPSQKKERKKKECKKTNVPGNQPQGYNNLRSIYVWKTAEIQVRTVKLCDTLFGGSSHTLTPPQALSVWVLALLY